MSIIQSVAFYRSEMPLKEAKDFLRRHGFKHEKLDLTPNLFRFRQVDPEPLERKGFRFRTQSFPGGFFVIAYGKD